MNTFGDYISRLRNYSKMTQEQLAEKMEVSKTTIQNWESGRTKVKPAHLKKLAYLFNVPEASLITELNRENDSMRNDVFPYFLIEDDKGNHRFCSALSVRSACNRYSPRL